MKKAKFNDLADRLMASIEKKELQPGDLLPSQYELADQYGLSRSCIQKALDILDKNGLIERKPGKGIFVRQKHSSSENMTKKIAYIMPDYARMAPDAQDNYGLKILLGIEEGARQIKATLIFKRIDMRSETGLLNNIVRELDVDGVIIHMDVPDNDIKKLSILDFPVVVAGRISTLPEVGAVAPNFIDSFLGIFRRLAAQGIRKVSFVYNSKYAASIEVPILKELAHVTGIVTMNYIDYAGEENNFHKIIKGLISNNSLPEVFCCFNDWGAKHVISALASFGKKVPEDMGIVGAIDFDFSTYVQPSLTTLSVDPSKIGTKAVELLDNMLKGGMPFTERIPMVLIQRESFIFKPQA